MLLVITSLFTMQMGQFYYAAKAFDVLERLDPNPDYWEVCLWFDVMYHGYFAVVVLLVLIVAWSRKLNGRASGVHALACSS